MTTEELLAWFTKIGGAIGAVVLLLVNIKKIGKFFYDFSKLPESLKRIESSITYSDGSLVKDALRRIEENQLMQQHRIQFMLDSNPEIGIFETDEFGNCIKVSNGYCKILGKTEDECLGTKWVSSIYSQDKDKVFNEWSTCVKFGRAFDTTFRFIRQNGSPFEVKSRANPVFNKSGKIIAWIGLITLTYS